MHQRDVTYVCNIAPEPFKDILGKGGAGNTNIWGVDSPLRAYRNKLK